MEPLRGILKNTESTPQDKDLKIPLMQIDDYDIMLALQPVTPSKVNSKPSKGKATAQSASPKVHFSDGEKHDATSRTGLSLPSPRQGASASKLPNIMDVPGLDHGGKNAKKFSDLVQANTEYRLHTKVLEGMLSRQQKKLEHLKKKDKKQLDALGTMQKELQELREDMLKLRDSLPGIDSSRHSDASEDTPCPLSRLSNTNLLDMETLPVALDSESRANQASPQDYVAPPPAPLRRSVVRLSMDMPPGSDGIITGSRALFSGVTEPVAPRRHSVIRLSLDDAPGSDDKTSVIDTPVRQLVRRRKSLQQQSDLETTPTANSTKRRRTIYLPDEDSSKLEDSLAAIDNPPKKRKLGRRSSELLHKMVQSL
ncbi:hypothetical protein F4777DRAFT_581358 [Nemania sp. FL0916]|nr:hypothetical protein F4777DRAFT_581358 [Nemania sp. FL0916]